MTSCGMPRCGSSFMIRRMASIALLVRPSRVEVHRRQGNWCVAVSVVKSFETQAWGRERFVAWLFALFAMLAGITLSLVFGKLLATSQHATVRDPIFIVRFGLVPRWPRLQEAGR